MSSLVYPRFVLFVGIMLSLAGLVLSYLYTVFFSISLLGGFIFGVGLTMLDSAKNSLAYQKYKKEREEREKRNG
ncbi:MAG: hypothetical protein G01um10143_534 [Parcubacteria group bacterium Gr01-1014_3]|nr:MAG: hypothetical protein G01um10143_534 [Parcubacteria group bacterium Gr01-1014_3]